MAGEIDEAWQEPGERFATTRRRCQQYGPALARQTGERQLVVTRSPAPAFKPALERFRQDRRILR